MKISKSKFKQLVLEELKVILKEQSVATSAGRPHLKISKKPKEDVPLIDLTSDMKRVGDPITDKDIEDYIQSRKKGQHLEDSDCSDYYSDPIGRMQDIIDAHAADIQKLKKKAERLKPALQKKSYLRFDGSRLIWVANNTMVRTWPATSGKMDIYPWQGQDTRALKRALAHIPSFGPIPAGLYRLDRIQNNPDLERSDMTKMVYMYDHLPDLGKLPKNLLDNPEIEKLLRGKHIPPNLLRMMYDPKFLQCSGHWRGEKGRPRSQVREKFRQAIRDGGGHPLDLERVENMVLLTAEWKRADSIWTNIAWGEHRILIHPSNKAKQKGRMYGRTEFFLHGGDVPGSSGCIDLGNYIKDFAQMWSMNSIARRSKGIPLIVDYGGGIKEQILQDHPKLKNDKLYRRVFEKDFVG